jgi:two-component system phosphate regulon sensor histidine kinase PhoR
MVKKVFRSVLLTTALVLIAAVALIIIAVNNYFIAEQKKVLESQTDLAAAGVESSGKDYLETLRSDQYRITWIDNDGEVLYDNQKETSAMENHANREEVVEAFQTGSGECERYSSTLSAATMYYAEKLDDNTVIRLAVTRDSIWLMVLRMITPFLWIVIAAIAASVFIARRIAHSLTDPLNHLDLENPLENQIYPEIQPLLVRLDAQNHKISDQMEELHRKQKEFRTVTNAISEGLMLYDRDGRLLSYNDAAAALLHLSEEDTTLPQPVAKILQSGLKDRKEESVVEMDGRNFRVDVSPIHSHGVLTGAAVLLMDITESWQAELIRREFTANVSHELKTPLQSIMGSSELLQNNLVKAEDRPAFYQKIHSESSRLLSLIDDIIRLSQLDEDTQLDEAELDLKDAAREAAEALGTSAQKHGVKLELKTDHARIHANFRLVYEIAYNLIDNAIRYNKPDGSVTVITRRRNDMSELIVKDTGIGIPEEAQSRVFERFYRVDKSHSRATGGTGLGLSIVKHSVQRCHGTIRLESQPGKGSTFTVSF